MNKAALKPGANFYNVVYSLAGKGVSLIALMLLDILETRLLGQTLYGEWAYFFAILNICFFIGWAGINNSAKVIVSHCDTVDARTQCLNASIILRLISAFVISILVVIVLYVIAPELGYPDKYPHLKSLIFLSVGMIFFNAFAVYYKHLFVGLGNFKDVFIVTVLEYFLNLLFCWLFLKFFHNIEAVAYGYIVSGLILLIIGLCLIKKDYRIFEAIDESIIKEYTKKIIKYALPMFVVGIGAAILIELDTFMLGILSTNSEVAVYSIAKNLTNKAGHVNVSIATGVMTSFVIINQNEKKAKIKKFNRYAMVNFAVALFIAVFIFVLAPILIPFLYGSEYVKAAEIFRVLTIFHMMNAVSNFYATFLDFRGKANIRSITYVVVILLDIALNYLLIPGMGAMGATIATEVSMLPYVFVTVFFSYKEIKTIEGDGIA